MVAATVVVAAEATHERTAVVAANGPVVASTAVVPVAPVVVLFADLYLMTQPFRSLNKILRRHSMRFRSIYKI